MHPTTSISSNTTTRALILWRVIFPASAQRKRVLGQTPSRSAIDLALLNLRPPTPLSCASLSVNDFVFCMASFCGIRRASTTARPPRNYGRSPTAKGVVAHAPPSFIAHPQPRSVRLVLRNTSALVLVIDAPPSFIAHPQLRSVWLVPRNTYALVLVIDAIP